MKGPRATACFLAALLLLGCTGTGERGMPASDTQRDAADTGASAPTSPAQDSGPSPADADAASTSDPATEAREPDAQPAERDAATPPPAGDIYANVVAVSATGNGPYTFHVTVESADIDCSQFANWWEVLSEEGALIYRRILLHSHTDENGTTDPDAPGNTFTRGGGPVDITADDTVIVRAHMSTGGYQGTAMRGSVGAGFTEAPDIGSDFAAAVEDEPPQPTGCQF